MSADRSSFVRILKSLLFQYCLQALLSAVDQIRDLPLIFIHDLSCHVVAHIFKVDEIECLPVLRLQLSQCVIELMAPFIFKKWSLGERTTRELKRKIVKKNR